MAMRLGPMEFWVKGSGKFPLDMLRRDGCYPDRLADVDAMNAEGERSVKLTTLQYPNWKPTVAGWEKFGWKVVPQTA